MITCTACGDTHRLVGERFTSMCTYCPTPCQQCRAGGNGPYCARTPCICSCHTTIGSSFTHELKCWPAPFDAMALGDKRFEFRADDREPRYKVGDTLRLRRWDPSTTDYTGRELWVDVTYVLRDALGLPPGFCVMSVRPSP